MPKQRIVKVDESELIKLIMVNIFINILELFQEEKYV
jgi:hypothetical protein